MSLLNPKTWKPEYADLICEVCCVPLHAPVYERADDSLVCSLCA